MNESLKYTYICPCCGKIWGRNKYKNQCPNCQYWCVICSYSEDDLIVNEEAFAEVFRNVSQNKRYQSTCEDCGKPGNLYFDKWCRCFCGGLMVADSDTKDLLQKIKTYRKQKKLSQRLMADKLGVTRSVLSMVELGTRELPYSAIVKLNKLLQ